MNTPAERDLPAGRHRLLKEFVMTEIANTPTVRSRLKLLAPVGALAAAVAVAVPLLMGTPAHAVTELPGGLIDITINEAKDPGRLQADLRALGANVVVDYVPKGKKCGPEPRAAHFLSKEEAALSVFPPPQGHETSFVIDPKVIGQGRTGVLEFSVSEEEDGARVAGIWARVAEGPVADCVLTDTPGAPLDH
ncbi:hypothetical protein DP939_19535 [Spongiactinospora rosea]|uniref:Uncharacterized protein n=1 Tax=Spongiactinospora rosea TaxID=2248750 RepID=A0A366LZD2_9ACTN|nr:hypothetical protein [Spongiactinospora rosea]RBQ18674.1 hypothetical protein DP939_19535 [Spongiactinospora rosea]